VNEVAYAMQSISWSQLQPSYAECSRKYNSWFIFKCKFSV